MSDDYQDPAGSQWTTPPAGAKYEALFIAASSAHQLPPGLLSRVAYQESRYRPDARSPAGALGIMQIVPYWHPGVDPLDPDDAVPYAAKYLRENFDRFGTWAKALAAYNWGPTALARAVQAHGEGGWLAAAPAETRNYVRDVTADTGVA